MVKVRKNLKILNELENNNNVVKDVSIEKDNNNTNIVKSINHLNNLVVINIDSIKALESIEPLNERQLASWWTMVIADKNLPIKDRLAASDKLAKYNGMYEKSRTIATSGGAVYKWKSTVEAEIVPEEKTTPDTSVDKN